jgi:hypothetical protein
MLVITLDLVVQSSGTRVGIIVNSRPVNLEKMWMYLKIRA